MEQKFERSREMRASEILARANVDADLYKSFIAKSQKNTDPGSEIAILTGISQLAEEELGLSADEKKNVFIPASTKYNLGRSQKKPRQERCVNKNWLCFEQKPAKCGCVATSS